jgi:hypothetical protein
VRSRYGCAAINDAEAGPAVAADEVVFLDLGRPLRGEFQRVA